MRKIKGFFCTLAILLLIPFNVFADSKEKINVYIFKGEGCGFCAKALTFLNGLDAEYQSYFTLVEKEVWKDENNAADMQKVANYFNENVKGVPYIIIGDKTFQGFDEEEYGEDIKKAIKESYENADGKYQDIVASILDNKPLKKDNNSAVTIIVIVAAIAGIGFLIYMARDEEEEIIVEEKATTKKVLSKPESVEKKKTSTKSASATKKKTTTKKTSTKADSTTKKKATAKKTTKK